MRTKAIFAAASVALLSTNASAADWVYSTTSTTEVAFYFDATGIKPGSNLQFVWVKSINPKPIKPGALSHSVGRYQINCQASTYTALSSIAYDEKGAVIASSTTETWNQRPTIVAPDTVFEGVLADICARANP